MDAKDIAIKLYTEFQKQEDKNLHFLRSYLLLKDADIKDVNEVIEIYEELVAAKAYVAVVATRMPLTDLQKKEIEKKVKGSIKADKFYFKYVVNKEIGSTLKVEVNDKIFKYSI